MKRKIETELRANAKRVKLYQQNAVIEGSMSMLSTEMLVQILASLNPTPRHIEHMFSVSQRFNEICSSEFLWVTIFNKWFGGSMKNAKFTGMSPRHICESLAQELSYFNDTDYCAIRDWAVQGGHTQVLLQVLKTMAEKPDWVRLLFEVCKFGHSELIQFVVEERGIAINTRDSLGVTPLLVTAAAGHHLALEKVISLGGDIHAQFNRCYHAYCTGSASKSVVSSLFVGIPDGATALWIASFKGHGSVVSSLLLARADVDGPAGDGSTPFYIACKQNQIEVVRAILEHTPWPDVNIRYKRDNFASPLYVICDAHHVEILQLLLDYKRDKGLPLDLESANVNGATGLYISAQMGYLDAVDLLLDANANVEARRSSGATPVLIASLFGQVNVVERLIRAGADINVRAYDGMSPLFGAVSKDREQVVDTLLASNVEVTDDVRALARDRNFGSIFVKLTVKQREQQEQQEQQELQRKLAVEQNHIKQQYDEISVNSTTTSMTTTNFNTPPTPTIETQITPKAETSVTSVKNFQVAELAQLVPEQEDLPQEVQQVALPIQQDQELQLHEHCTNTTSQSPSSSSTSTSIQEHAQPTGQFLFQNALAVFSTLFGFNKK